MALPVTREQLLRLKRQRESIRRGLFLLEKKRDALIAAIEKVRKRFETLRQQFIKKSRTFSMAYSQLRFFEGAFPLDFLKSSYPVLDIRTERNTLMGCVFFQFYPQKKNESEKDSSRQYDPALSSFFVDDLENAMEGIQAFLWEYINLLARLDALQRELKKIRRKAGNLEQNVLPVIHEDFRRIQGGLEERERQERQIRKRVASSKKYKRFSDL